VRRRSLGLLCFTASYTWTFLSTIVAMPLTGASVSNLWAGGRIPQTLLQLISLMCRLHTPPSTLSCLPNHFSTTCASHGMYVKKASTTQHHSFIFSYPATHATSAVIAPPTLLSCGQEGLSRQQEGASWDVGRRSISWVFQTLEGEGG